MKLARVVDGDGDGDGGIPPFQGIGQQVAASIGEAQIQGGDFEHVLAPGFLGWHGRRQMCSKMAHSGRVGDNPIVFGGQHGASAV